MKILPGADNCQNKGRYSLAESIAGAIEARLLVEATITYLLTVNIYWAFTMCKALLQELHINLLSCYS